MTAALEYLKKREWSMGNGQCPDCCGVSARWHGDPSYMEASSIGHKPGCPLAAALVSVGGDPLMLGSFKSSKKFERVVIDGWSLGTREAHQDASPG